MSFLSDLATIIRSGATIKDIKELKEAYETNPTMQKVMEKPEEVKQKNDAVKQNDVKVETKNDEETIVDFFAQLAKEENHNG